MILNILFTCAGRRNYLLEYFKTIKNVKVYACDASVYAPALYIADEFFIVPEVYDPGYTDVLFNEAKERKINAIIPLNDLELPILAKENDRFNNSGIRLVISDSTVIDTCFDKYKTISFTESIPVRKIPTFLKISEALGYKKANPECMFVVKPRWGTASIGIEYPKNNDELAFHFDQVSRKIKNSFLKEISATDFDNSVIIQRLINGQEYGMDIINNLNAEYESCLIRRKVSMRAGETDKAVAVHDERLRDVGEQIGRTLRHVGLLDCDLIIEDDNIYLLEMNPRFGGGYPFSHLAGTNVPLALAEWLKGNETPSGCFNYVNGFVSGKADKIVPMNNKEEVLIVGASGFGRELESWLSLSCSFNENYSIKGYLDDNLNALDGFPSDHKVLSKIDDYPFSEKDIVIIGVADPVVKENIIGRLANKVRFLSFISDRAVIGKYNEIGEGSIIAPNTIISSNISIGKHVTINVDSVIGHDAIISDFSSIMANVNVGGGVVIDKNVYIGSNTTIVPARKIGANTRICAGSAILKNVPESSLAFGNPARMIDRSNKDT